MNKKELFSFYEKLYFQELERREKLSSRLNVPLGILVAVVGLLSFMLNNAPVSISGWSSFFFLGFFCICLLRYCGGGMVF